MSEIPLAHSGRAERNVPPQPYWKHVDAVVSLAEEFARAATANWNGEREELCAEVRAGALFHDCGKLCSENQTVLASSATAPLPIRHEDAGAALLMQAGREKAAMLVYSHHAGLPSEPEELRGTVEQPPKPRYRRLETLVHTETNLGMYAVYYSAQGLQTIEGAKPIKWSGLTHRIALSCLVDGDHTDTARNYGEAKVTSQPGRWAERLDSLDRYVSKLEVEGANATRQRNRAELYRVCREAELSPGLQSCEAPVGTGKTTAVMAHLLRAACEKNLRHIFVVLPYTNIIQQAVEVYRKALVLPGENPEEIVAELHHLADFAQPDARQMAARWCAPIIVTTAVQFFETIAASMPAHLRKLHELPSSAVFIDEAHACLPVWLWPQTWLWIKELVDSWNCHFVLGSGSLSRFWRIKEIVDPPETVPDLVPTELQNALVRTEQSRIIVRRQESAKDLGELVAFVRELPGPRLVILNTVQNAAVTANQLKTGGSDVMHLSTALAPADRKNIVDHIKRRLRTPDDSGWTLVATSCVEAGLDFSFRCAVRESCSVASIVQTGGRTNRESKWNASEVWDVRLQDPLFNHHPAFEQSRKVLKTMLQSGTFDRGSPAGWVTEALRREILLRFSSSGDELKKLENRLDFPGVAKLYTVIDTRTCLVVVHHELIEKLERHERVASRDLLLGSVQMWASAIDRWAVQKFNRFDELYKWTAAYDPQFLGYMEGALPMVLAGKGGGYVV